jgi:hypothetical protein
MNLTGDSRYLTDDDWRAWPEAQGDPERALAASRQPEGQPLDAPAGYFGWRAAFGPDGHYGRWLATRPAFVVIGTTAFVHGGLSPLVGQLGGEALNLSLARKLPRLLELGARERASGALAWNADLLYPSEGADPDLLALAADPMFGSDGPMWYRGNCWCPALLEGPSLGATLGELGAERVVVGHTPTPSREVTTRLGGRVIMLDTGMLASHYRGQVRALVIEDGKLRVIGAEGSAQSLIAQGPDVNPPGWTDADLEATLASSPASVDGPLASFSTDGCTVVARFTPGRAAEIAASVAGYRLDRRLGLGMVPVTVRGTLDGVAGTFSVEEGHWLNEAERVERGLAFENWCVGAHPFQLVAAFDTLIGNTRTAETLAYDFTTMRIRLTGQGGAFGTKTRIDGFDSATIPAALVTALRGLDRSVLEDYLDRRKANALLKRRDMMLAQH